MLGDAAPGSIPSFNDTESKTVAALNSTWLHHVTCFY